MITIAYHADLNEAQDGPHDRPCLAALCGAPHAGASFDDQAPFDRLEWWQGLAQHCGVSPLLAVARDDDSIAVLPLMQGPRRLEALANWYNFSWRPLGGGPALLTALARDLAHRTSRITLAPLHEADADVLAAAFRAAGWVVDRAVCNINHILPVGARSFAEYLASRPGPLRTTLARKSGKVAVEILTHFDEAAWTEYEAVYADSWKPSEGSPAFLRAFAREEGAAGRLRMGIARAEGEPIAAQFWTVEAGTAFIHKLAHRESAKQLSPGTTLTAALLEHVIDSDHVALVDFGTGDEPYKRDWMDATRPLSRLDLFHPSATRWWPHIARAVMRRLAARPSRG